MLRFDQQRRARHMSYVDSTLLPGEEVTFRTHLHWLIFARAAFVLAIGLAALALGYPWAPAVWFGGACALLGLIGWLGAYIQRQTSEFAVTNKRVIVKTGILRRRTVEMLLRQIEALEVNQSLAGRVLGFGSVIIIGTGGTREPFDKVSAPLEFRRAAQAASAP
jgi:uncharacterized membrane protein YdbT with pleckstrin-like domain